MGPLTPGLAARRGWLSACLPWRRRWPGRTCQYRADGCSPGCTVVAGEVADDPDRGDPGADHGRGDAARGQAVLLVVVSGGDACGHRLGRLDDARLGGASLAEGIGGIRALPDDAEAAY